MSPQLVDFLKPLDVDGLLTQPMVHALRVLRQNAAVLLNVMQVPRWQSPYFPPHTYSAPYFPPPLPTILPHRSPRLPTRTF